MSVFINSDGVFIIIVNIKLKIVSYKYILFPLPVFWNVCKIVVMKLIMVKYFDNGKIY